MNQIIVRALIALALVHATSKSQADEISDQQQAQAVQQIQATQQAEQMQEYGRQASEDWEAQQPAARGRAIREEYLERQAFEKSITGGE
jgi:hypothetical protein